MRATSGALAVVFIAMGAAVGFCRTRLTSEIGFAELFFGTERGGNYMSAAGPLAEIDQAAALGAKGEIGFGAQHELPAGGTTEAASTLVRHGGTIHYAPGMAGGNTFTFTVPIYGEDDGQG